MDENLIQEAFNMLGVNVHNIKIIRNKDNGYVCLPCAQFER